jgi:hypothetical protein
VPNQLKQVTKLANALPSFGKASFLTLSWLNTAYHGKLTWKTLVITMGREFGGEKLE